MAVVTNFNTSLVLKNWDVFEQLKVKLGGFHEVFDAIIDRWIWHNKAKFEQARGTQLMGVIFDSDVEPVMWAGVTDEYAAEKTRAGFPNWLMVRTGELMGTLTNRGAGFGYYESIEADNAIFGSALDTAYWHRFTRPVNFLDAEDRQMIPEMFGAYLNGEPPFKGWRPSETKRMDAEFKSMFKGVTLPGPTL